MKFIPDLYRWYFYISLKKYKKLYLNNLIIANFNKNIINSLLEKLDIKLQNLHLHIYIHKYKFIYAVIFFLDHFHDVPK